MLLLLVFIVSVFAGEKCPPIVGEAECPLNHFCKDKACYNSIDAIIPSSFCNNVVCPEDTVCRVGMCYPMEQTKCNRHVLVADGEARSLVTDCGPKGKCINGHCTRDRCMGLYCPDGMMCRDGTCIQVAGTFCLGHADCGPNMDCIKNTCALNPALPTCNCSPMEICRSGVCYPNARESHSVGGTCPGCASIRCEPGYFCVNGVCIPAVGQSCAYDVCHGGTVCMDGVCRLDNCLGKCPAEYNCRRGECRLMLGLPCIDDCEFPYECVDGRCVKDGCKGRICQTGQACENGMCVKITGRFCIVATRDCAVGFACERNLCVETQKWDGKW